MNNSALDFIINGGETVRYHTWPVLRRQNVGEHSFRVAMLCGWLAGQHAEGEKPVGIGANLLMAALTHDLAEHQMGDLPAPVKRGLPDVIPSGDARPFREYWDFLENRLLAEVGLDWAHTLNEYEKRILKLADAACGALYCARERMMGNKLIDPVFDNFYAYATEKAANNPEEVELMRHIRNSWAQACRL